jgi:hypothetical protein
VVISANQFVKAVSTAPSLTAQNQAMEQVSADFADIINQLVGTVPTPKDVEDVRYLTSLANAKLRVLMEQLRLQGSK